MDRNEAIEILTDIKRIRSNTITEACDMAISALKGGDAEMNETKSPFMQETPSEDGSDLISRAEALKKAEKGNITTYSTNSVNIHTTDVVTVENINKLPSVSAEPKHGEWIHDEARVYVCSECKVKQAFISLKPSHYCPNCGARMENKK